jgi:hypothetical protein
MTEDEKKSKKRVSKPGSWSTRFKASKKQESNYK